MFLHLIPKIIILQNIKILIKNIKCIFLLCIKFLLLIINI